MFIKKEKKKRTRTDVAEIAGANANKMLILHTCV